VWSFKSVPGLTGQEKKDDLFLFGTQRPANSFAPLLNPTVAPFSFSTFDNAGNGKARQVKYPAMQSYSLKQASSSLSHHQLTMHPDIVREAEVSLSAVIARLLN